jgi:hypothetical protein
MKAEDIINWPSGIEFKPVNRLDIKDLEIIDRLAKEDRLYFSSQFLGQFGRNRNQLRSDVTKYLGAKLAKNFNRPRVQIPWAKLVPGDIINWPSNVEFVRVQKMDTKDLRTLSKLAKEDRLDFSPEFLGRFKISNQQLTNRDKLRSDILKYLADKLARKLNVFSIEVPWSEVKAGDIIGWPSSVKFMPVKNMDTKGLKSLYKLAKKGRLDFSTDFLDRLKSINGGKSYRDKLRSDVSKYLGDKLAKKLNLSHITIPWSKMKAGDITNWPQDIKFQSVFKLNIRQLQALHELASKDQLDFSSNFLQLSTSKLRGVKFKEIMKDIETTLCNKLSAGTNKTFRRVPWSMLKKQDVINWPAGVPFERLSRNSLKRLKLLHKLRDVIFFSKDFLNTLSDAGFDRTPIGKFVLADDGAAKGR